jgi:DNA-binding transcriptional LysR family regulator
MWEWLGRIKSTWSWGRFAWQLAGALGLTGLLSSVGGTVWAMIQGVPLPIALMVGYCTLVGAVYLAMAPLAYRALAQSPANSPQPKKPKPPNYAAVRLMHQYTLSEASRLWCDIDQSASPTMESNSWEQALAAAIQRGDLGFIPKYTAQPHLEKRKPEWSTIIPRSALQEFAAKIGQHPRFLRDAD